MNKMSRINAISVRKIQIVLPFPRWRGGTRKRWARKEEKGKNTGKIKVMRKKMDSGKKDI